MGRVELLRAESDRVPVLHDDATELDVGGVSADVKRFGAVRIFEQDLPGDKVAHSLEGVSMCRSPLPFGGLAGKLG